MKFYCDYAKSTKEIFEAKKIILNNFKIKKTFIFNKRKEKIFYIKIKNKIIGCVKVINKKIIFLRKKIKVAGFAYICIDKKFRGRGYSRILINQCINAAIKNNFDIILLFARKKLSNFYCKFGFDSQCPYSLTNVENNYYFEDIKKNFSYVPFNKSKINFLNKCYNKTYDYLNFFFIRNKKDWSLVNFYCKKNFFNFKIIEHKKKKIGYIIYKKNNIIYELGCLSKDKLKHIKLFLEKNFKKNFLFNYIVQKDLISLFKKENVKHNLSFSNSGPMIKILKLKKIIRKSGDNFKYSYMKKKFNNLDKKKNNFYNYFCKKAFLQLNQF